jgi:hypothetical protein
MLTAIRTTQPSANEVATALTKDGART